MPYTYHFDCRPHTGSSAYRTMSAKKPGTCHGCGGGIEGEQKIAWFPEFYGNAQVDHAAIGAAVGVTRQQSAAPKTSRAIDPPDPAIEELRKRLFLAEQKLQEHADMLQYLIKKQ